VVPQVAAWIAMQILRHELGAAKFDGKGGGMATEELAISASNQTGQNPVSSATVKPSRRNGSEKSVARKDKSKERKEYLKTLEADAQAFVDCYRAAKKISDDVNVLHRKFGDLVESMRPVFERVRDGFAHLKKGEMVMGERTGPAWASKHLGVTYDWLCRCLNRLKAGTLLLTDGTKVVAPTPAKPDRSDTEQEISLPRPTHTLPTLPPADTADWTDNQYIKTCVDFFESTLRPLEGDPQRFHRVATAIAQEILGDMQNEHSTVGQDSALAAVNE